MFFIERKTMTLRTAVAEAKLSLAAETLARVQENNTPKGNVIELARAAGVMAAKRTSELIPYCHPMPLDGVSVDFVMEDGAIKVKTMVTTVWKTGVEMEALTAASVAALTLYDMLKPIDKQLEIGDLRVVEKSGGKSAFKDSVPPGFRAAVVVTSDGTHAGKRQDKSGQLICQRLESLGVKDIRYDILPDDLELIRNKLLQLCETGVDLIVTTGGTGLGPRDVTVEATAAVVERQIPGIVEAMRSYGQDRTPYAMLSRGIAGLRGNTLILNCPGSSRGTAESLDAIFPALLHSYPMLRGGKH